MEIVARAAVMFLFLWVVTRLVGRSALTELNTFQLVLFITMGDLAQQAVTQQDNSVTGGVLAISVFALLTVALMVANSRWPRARKLTHGEPVVVVRDGEPLGEVLRRERVALDDLAAAAREQGITTFGEIDLAVLEVDGKISFFHAAAGRGGPREPSAPAG